MRIADKMNYDQVKANISKNRQEMADLQNQAATQKRVNKPSDDPLSATRVLSARTDITSGQQFLRSINQAKTFLEYSDQALGELTEVLTRAKELALSQASDASANDQTRSVTAAEIEQLFQQSVQIGNRKQGDRFIFGGFRTTRPPFDPNGRYFGDTGEIKISIEKEGSIAMNMPGSRIFLGQDLKSPATIEPSNEPQIQTDDPSSDSMPMRGPASIESSLASQGASREPQQAQQAASRPDLSGLSDTWRSQGVSVFKVLNDLSTGLRANDKEGVQESLDRLDEALAQVILSRSQMGARLTTINTSMESLQKGQVDAKALASSLEDADTFELVTDLNKNESTLKATLATTGKLIQPSLLDFLR